jgi:hypothetical protein
VDDVLVVPFPSKRDLLVLVDKPRGEYSEFDLRHFSLRPTPQERSQHGIGMAAASNEAHVITVASGVDDQVHWWSDAPYKRLGHAELSVLVDPVFAVRLAIDNLASVLSEESARVDLLLEEYAVDCRSSIHARRCNFGIVERQERRQVVDGFDVCAFRERFVDIRAGQKDRRDGRSEDIEIRTG